MPESSCLERAVISAGLLFFLLLQAAPAQAQKIPEQSSSRKKWELGSKSDTLPAGLPRYHSPVKASWMSAALPGLGQIYNRKWWKLPIVYGALGAAGYFLIYSQSEYIKARDSYRALMLPQPNPYQVHPDYEDYDAFAIKSFRDYYRQNRDYGIVAVAAVYALQILDATVDAHLMTFDVSDRLTLRIAPSPQPFAASLSLLLR